MLEKRTEGKENSNINLLRYFNHCACHSSTEDLHISILTIMHSCYCSFLQHFPFSMITFNGQQNVTQKLQVQNQTSHKNK
jgi:hypothetical protein